MGMSNFQRNLIVALRWYPPGMPEKLSDHEIRDITKALEAGKPLDDKYRYLIFKEARQVELIWNGKNPHVQSTVLPFQIIEHIDEPRDDVKL